MSINEQSSIDTYRLMVETINAILPDRGIIDQVTVSVEAIRERIDQAYNRICMDLPEINLEMHQTFEQASGTLDSLYAHGKKGMIENVAGDMERAIQNLALLMKPMRNFDAQVLETIELSYPNIEKVLFMLEDPLIDKGPVHEAKSLVMKLVTERDNLAKVFKASLELENSLIEEIISNIGKDARSLEYTLSSAILILKDLVLRSNSMKEPMLNIMSGLQAQDIVNQDITTISCALRKMSSLRSIPDNSDDILDTVLFQQQASSLSWGLISQLIKIVRDHGKTLCQEIERIEDTVSRIKEDKDAVGEFLLMNLSGESTFDIVLSEVSEIFCKITEKLEELVFVKELQQTQTDHFISLCDDFDQLTSSGTSTELHWEILEAMSKMTFLFKSLAKMIKYGYGSLDLKECSDKFGMEVNLIKRSLEEIKALLLGSIEGIDLYSCRCTDAITKFKLDIDKLNIILDGNENVFDGLSSFARSMTSVRDAIFHCTGLERGTVLTQGFKEILSRLENPHSNSLAGEEDHESGGDLVLF